MVTYLNDGVIRGGFATGRGPRLVVDQQYVRCGPLPDERRW
jgi:hypothetical protein